MLRILSQKSTGILAQNKIIPSNKTAIYVYGFELFYSTFFCVISILVLGRIFNYLELVITFLLYFMPIRVPAGGYHAKSYRGCFVLTNSVAFVCIFLSNLLWNILEREYVMWLIYGCSICYIWRQAPVVTRNHPLKKDRIIKNRKYAHIILIAETIVLLIARAELKGCIVYTSIITSLAVAIMIMAVRKGGGE